MRQNKERTVRTMLFLAVVFSMILIPSVSAIEDTELIYCDQNNMSLGQCLTFWAEVKQIIGNYTCEPCQEANYTNTTIVEYVEKNTTIYVDKNCSEEFQWFKYQKDHELEMAKINCTNTCEAVEGITNDQCNTKISEALDRARQNEGSSGNVSNPKSDSDIFMWILIFGAGVLIIYFVFIRKIKPSGSRSGFPVQQTPQYPTYPPVEPAVGYQPPVPPVPQPPQNPPEPPKPLDNGGDDGQKMLGQ